MMKRVVAILICVLAVLPAMSLPKAKRGRTLVQQEQNTPPASEYDKLFLGKKCITEKGLMTLHDVEGRLYVEMPVALMGRDMLIGSTISAITDNRIVSVGEKPRSPMQVTFELSGKKVNMCKRRFDITAAGHDMKEALRRNSMLGIISSFDIKAYSSDSTSVVLDMTDLFLGDNEQLRPFPSRPASDPVQINHQFRRDLSAIAGIKAFEDNVSIRSRLSYTVTMSDRSKRRAYMTNAPFTVEVTRSIVMLPEIPARERFADPRIGVFFQHRSIYGDASQGVQTAYYARRWRLEPSDSASYAKGELVAPKVPIVFYVDDAFPQMWKPYVEKGILAWNKAFENIGFKDAIRVFPFPTDDPQFDPDNLKYNCVRYSPSETANSAGPHWTDPRTGEIINASVYIYHNIVSLLRKWLFVQTAAADESVRTSSVPEELMGDCISYVVSHEMGHCLGLMHNMAGSSSIPVDSLRSATFTQKYGTTYSIMDYARFNFVAQPGDKERGVSLMPPELGKYDYYAIEWLYRPILSAETAKDEVPVLQKYISERSVDPAYRYGKQQTSARVDPSSFEEDLGDDPVKTAEYAIKNLKFIASHINGWLASEDADYSFRQEMHSQMVAQYQQCVTRVLYNIGGVYLNERFEGDALKTYEFVPAVQQKESVDYLLSCTKDLQWLDDCSVGSGWPLTSPLAHNMGVALFRTVLSRCGNLWYSAPLMGSEAYGQSEFLSDVSRFVWGPLRSGKGLTELEMEMQNQFVSWLMTNSDVVTQFKQGKPGYVQFASPEEDGSSYMGFAPFTGMQGAVPASKHLCFGKLKEALALLKKYAGHPDEATRQHCQMLIFRIEKEFD